jgi:integrase/recombinase XerC
MSSRSRRSPKSPTSLSAWAEEFLNWLLDSRGYSPATAETYRASLRDFDCRMGSLDPAQVTTRDLDRYAGRLALCGLSPNTRRSRVQALKSFYSYLVTRGHIASNPAAAFEVPRPKILERLPVFSKPEIEMLIFRFIAPRPERQRREPAVLFGRRLRLHELKEKRDSALLGLCYSLGLRAGEPGLLLMRDYSIENRVPVLTVRGAKRSVEPVTFRVDRRIETLITAYLEELIRQFPVAPAALFPALSFRRLESDRGLGRKQVGEILRQRIGLAGIESKGRRLSPHGLRYSVATHLAESRFPLPLREIQAHLRHRDFSTTLRYIRLGSFGSIQKRAIRALYWNAPPLSGVAPPTDGYE